MTAPALREAPFADLPCVVHSHHAPTPLLVQMHHVFPVEFQHTIWPTVDRNVAASIKAPHTIPVCGTGHDSIHVILREMVASGGNTKVSIGHAKEWQVAVDGYVQFKAAEADPTGWKPA